MSGSTLMPRASSTLSASTVVGPFRALHDDLRTYLLGCILVYLVLQRGGDEHVHIGGK